MSNAAKLKRKAVELEQKKQFDKALSLYIQFLQESEGALDDADVPLYNRVGDLMLRVGNTADALNYYEKAVDLYADRGFLNNAIALCNKVLRQAPGRSSIYYKLGKISASKGFKSDAKKNFLEYADRMQKAGHIDEAFRALKEFADLCPDQDDIRLMLAEQLSKEGRQDEALEQLQKLHDKLDREGRSAEARATVDRMKAIDPNAVPRVSGAYSPQKSSDLIFLDTSFDEPRRPRSPATPAGRPVSDPDLVVLTLADQPDAPVSPVHNAAVAGALGLDLDATFLDAPGAVAPPTDGLPLLALSEEGNDPVPPPSSGSLDGAVTFEPDALDAVTTGDSVPALELDGDHGAESFELPPGVDLGSPGEEPGSTAIDLDPAIDIGAFGFDAPSDPAMPDPSSESTQYVSGPPLGIDYVSDLAADGAPLPPAGGDLFDLRSPPRADAPTPDASPFGTLDPDVSFPSLGLEDMSLPSADEITSGGSLAAALGADEEGELLDVVLPAMDVPPPEAAVDHASAELPPFAMPDIESELIDAPAMIDVPAAIDAPADAAADAPIAVADAAGATLEELPDAVAPLLELAAPAEDEVAPPPAGDPEPADPEAETAQPVELQPQVGVDVGTPPRPADAWESRRTHAEQLMEAGDRAAGVRELELLAADRERAGDLEGALTITEELIRLAPGSIGHHQKRVELAFRSSDRAKLTDAYNELGDALFRSGEQEKARAVYHRVLELAPNDARARAALDSIASASPPAGSHAVAPPARARAAITPAPASGSPPPDAATRIGAPPRAGIAVTPQQPPKLAPLDPRAAMNGEFIDLGEWLREEEGPKSTRMVTDEKPPTGDEQADFQEMLKRFKQGVAQNVDEEDYESHYDLGVAYKEMGLVDEAVAEFQKALRGGAHRVRAYEALGQCFVEKEQFQVAGSVLTRAIALGEGDDHHLVGVLYLLGRATEALGRHRDALDYYQRVFAVDIEFRDVAERISAIQGKAT